MECSGCGIFAGMWNVDLQNAFFITVYKFIIKCWQRWLKENYMFIRTLYLKILYLELELSKSFRQRCLCNKSYYGESIKHLDIRSGEHRGVPPLTGKKVKPINISGVHEHLVHCNYLPPFDNFSILAHENKKFLLESKKAF